MDELRIWINCELLKTVNQIAVEKIAGNVVKENFWIGETSALRSVLAEMDERGL